MLLHRVSEILQDHGFSRFGYAQLSTPVTLHHYKTWLDKSFHGEMKYLETHLEVKSQPEKLLPLAQSAIVVAVDYVPHPQQIEYKNLKGLKIAKYAQGYDYHDWLKQKLEEVIVSLRDLYPNEAFLSCTDSYPVLERDLAQRAGLGWFGKNTCLIDQKTGSFFLIGEIYTSLKLQPSLDLASDRCGTCTRCIDACPTKALIEPHVLDATKCISYWTIESKRIAPEPLRSQIGSHYFGCDICQDICPWNKKVISVDMVKPTEHDTVKSLMWILNASSKEIKEAFIKTPLSRASASSHKRNAMYVIANLKILELEPYVANYLGDEKLADIASWCVKILRSSFKNSDLTNRLEKQETD